MVKSTSKTRLQELKTLVLRNKVYFSFCYDKELYYELHQYIKENNKGQPIFRVFQFPVNINKLPDDVIPMRTMAAVELIRAIKDAKFSNNLILIKEEHVGEMYE